MCVRACVHVHACIFICMWCLSLSITLTSPPTHSTHSTVDSHSCVLCVHGCGPDLPVVLLLAAKSRRER